MAAFTPIKTGMFLNHKNNHWKHKHSTDAINNLLGAKSAFFPREQKIPLW